MHEPDCMSQARLYLMDVEGTVAPLSLVTEQLFPYARAHFAEFLKKSAGDAAVREDLALLGEENRAEKSTGIPRLPLVDHPEQVETPRFRLDAFTYLIWLMDRDRKSTALKSLQGKVWRAGFESGRLKGTLFADVPPAFTRWAAKGQVAIYSSGSVTAQMLLFRHSTYGDLTHLISGYFDTHTGPKTAGASYAAIAAAMGVDAGAVLFFSDVVRELDAAAEAGCETRLVVRDGNAPIEAAHQHCAIESFAGL
jgi:2,3-diketo-5-methylthio-1-phosphopentane phosphatase